MKISLHNSKIRMKDRMNLYTAHAKSYTTFSVRLSIPVYSIQEAQPHFIFMRNLPTFGIYRGNFAKRKKFFLPFLFDLL